MKSKMTTENIFRNIFDLLRDWDEFDNLPRRFEASFADPNSWLRDDVAIITYEQFENLVMEQLGLTTQCRICKEKWNYLIRQNYVLSRKLNKTTTQYKLNLIEIREVLGLEFIEPVANGLSEDLTQTRPETCRDLADEEAS